MDAVRRGKDLFQAAFAVGKGLPQVEVDAALIGGHLGQLFVDRAEDVRGKAGLLLRSRRADRRDGLDVDHAVVAKGLAQQVKHLAVIGKEAVRRAEGGQGVGAQQDIELFRLGCGQHVQRDLLAAGGTLDGTAVDDGIRANAGIAANERPAEVDAVIREANRQAVAEEGRIGEVAQIDLPARGLTDHAAVIGFDAVGPGGLPGRAELFQRNGSGSGIPGAVRAALRAGFPGGAVRRALHRQRGQDVFRHAAGRSFLRRLALLLAVFKDGRDGQRQDQDGRNDPRQPQPETGPAALCAAVRRMILV